jgi:hypothetical protein
MIKDDRFDKLKKSIQDDPEMLELREVIAYQFNGDLVVIAGNMRLKACIDLGIKEIPIKILPTDTPIEKLKAYTIKDNVPFGENDWEAIISDWPEAPEWGLDIPEMFIKKEAVEDDPPGYADMSSQWFLNVRCNDEPETKMLYEKLTAEGYDCKIIT